MGDATGKGVPAALVMSTTCGMLQLAARALDSTSPGEVLAQVNETSFDRIPSNMFVTCFYCILDPKSGHLVYANAGHDLPYVRRGGDAEELRARGMPLGLMPGMGYEEREITLQAGESALFYSAALSRPTILRARCSASQGSGRLLPSTARSDLWGARFLRSFTPVLGTAGSRRTT